MFGLKYCLWPCLSWPSYQCPDFMSAGERVWYFIFFRHLNSWWFRRVDTCRPCRYSYQSWNGACEPRTSVSRPWGNMLSGLTDDRVGYYCDVQHGTYYSAAISRRTRTFWRFLHDLYYTNANDFTTACKSGGYTISKISYQRLRFLKLKFLFLFYVAFRQQSTSWTIKSPTSLLSISSPIIDRFSKFFQWHTLETICNSVIITYPATQ